MKFNFPKLLVLSCLLSGQVSAQWRMEVPFQVSTFSSQDSSVTVESKVLLRPETRWVWIRVSKGTQKTDYYFQAQGQSDFKNKVWLSHGPGTYRVRIMTSTLEGRFGTYLVADDFEIENTDQREHLDSLVPSNDIQSDDADMVDLAESIVHGLSSDLDKVGAIHDWVARNIAYDVNSFMDGTYILKTWDALAVLETKKAVCQGYANLTAALNRAIGIPSKVVVGEGLVRGQAWTGVTNHAWNETLVDGKWISQDTTWDAGYIDFYKRTFTFRPSRKYFNPSPEVFGLTHRAANHQ